METGTLILGVDGGGSRSEARLWVGDAVATEARGLAVNPNHVGPERSLDSLSALLVRLRKASPSRACSDVDAACMGLSGVSHPSSRDIVKKALETAGWIVRGPRILVGDAVLCLEAAFGGAVPSGVVLVCGTGSIALARDGGGEIQRAGGAGPGRGDEGGGHWIGQQALALGLVAAPQGDGEGPAALVPAVAQSALEGDERACVLLDRAAQELVRIAGEVARQARLGASFEVCLAGGLAVHVPDLSVRIGRALAAVAPSVRLGITVRDPLAGALSLARRALAGAAHVPPGW